MSAPVSVSGHSSRESKLSNWKDTKKFRLKLHKTIDKERYSGIVVYLHNDDKSHPMLLHFPNKLAANEQSSKKGDQSLIPLTSIVNPPPTLTTSTDKNRGVLLATCLISLQFNEWLIVVRAILDLSLIHI